MPEISAIRFRAGEGEPLVLVHGFTATWRIWLPVLPELVARFDVLAPTLHGHDGGPPVPFGVVARTPGEAADHLEAQLDEQGIGEAHLVGNSMGGAIVLELAKRGRARSVVAISPGGGWEPHSGEGERLVRSFARTQRICRRVMPRVDQIVKRPSSRRFAFREIMRHGDRLPPKEAARLIRSAVCCDVVEDVFSSIRSGEALLRDLHRIECPVLVAWPQLDTVLPMALHAPRFRREIPGVDFTVLEGTGHVPTWDDPDLVASTISRFVARVTAGDLHAAG